MLNTILARPPRVAAWLARLFISSTHAESLQGDLQEEFCALAANSGVASARRWYWRQSIKTILFLLGTAFHFAASPIVSAVAGGMLLQWLGRSLPERLIVAILRQFPIYPNHWNAYVFWITDGILIGDLLESIFVGAIVAFAAKGKELAATMALSTVLFTLGTGSSLWLMASHSPGSFVLLQRIVDLCIHGIAIILGGIIIREFRSYRSHRLATA
jgi:hypothetical protein